MKTDRRIMKYNMITGYDCTFACLASLMRLPSYNINMLPAKLEEGFKKCLEHDYDSNPEELILEHWDMVGQFCEDYGFSLLNFKLGEEEQINLWTSTGKIGPGMIGGKSPRLNCGHSVIGNLIHEPAAGALPSRWVCEFVHDPSPVGGFLEKADSFSIVVPKI